MQQKQRGMMGSFVNNINRQVDKITTMSEDIVSRVGARALDLPLRELNVRFKGSGNERVFEAYMKEISAEIQKLSQGSTASIAQLPEQNRLEWEKIHDVNLSMNELKKVLAGTKEMANMRIGSVNDEIAYTLNKLGNVPEEISRLKANDNLNPKEITTQEEYDALNPGDTFLENGYRFIKPENNNGQ
jgi:DNA primase catalytic subunit